jgi:hypothetical protein
VKTDLTVLLQEKAPISLIVCAGFEARTPRAAALLGEIGVRPRRILVLTYGGKAHQKSYSRLMGICKTLVSSNLDLSEINAFEFTKIKDWLDQTVEPSSLLLCDITGLARTVMFALLSTLQRSDLNFWLLYTEARRYYPTKTYFRTLLSGGDTDQAFFKLSKYEETEIVYSGSCHVEELPGFEGNHLPNYPLMLIAFLTFKRSRLGAILREYEANVRVLVKGVPVRSDLKWRERAMETINFDLIEDNKNSLFSVETLDWQQTYLFLQEIHSRANNKYRYNFMLAPLGSKMQTVGAWQFAHQHPEIKVVTSTPSKLFPEKYSIGYGNTFLIDDICSPNK